MLKVSLMVAIWVLNFVCELDLENNVAVVRVLDRKSRYLSLRLLNAYRALISMDEAKRTWHN